MFNVLSILTERQIRTCLCHCVIQKCKTVHVINIVPIIDVILNKMQIVLWPCISQKNNVIMRFLVNHLLHWILVWFYVGCIIDIFKFTIEEKACGHLDEMYDKGGLGALQAVTTKSVLGICGQDDIFSHPFSDGWWDPNHGENIVGICNATDADLDAIVYNGIWYNNDFIEYVQPLSKPVLAVGHRYACAILANGSAMCWGSDSSIRLGDGDDLEEDEPNPVFVNTTYSFDSLYGGYLSCGLLVNGSAMCWGNDGNGRFGDGGAVAVSKLP